MKFTICSVQVGILCMKMVDLLLYETACRAARQQQAERETAPARLGVEKRHHCAWDSISIARRVVVVPIHDVHCVLCYSEQELPALKREEPPPHQCKPACWATTMGCAEQGGSNLREEKLSTYSSWLLLGTIAF